MRAPGPGVVPAPPHNSKSGGCVTASLKGQVLLSYSFSEDTPTLGLFRSAHKLTDQIFITWAKSDYLSCFLLYVRVGVSLNVATCVGMGP